MKLHAIGWVFTMFERHDLSFRGRGKDFEFSRHRLVDNERVIAHTFEGRRDILEDSFAIVIDNGSLPVHETFGAVHFAAVDGTQALMPEADPEHRDFACEMLDGIRRDTAILDRFARTG